MAEEELIPRALLVDPAALLGEPHAAVAEHRELVPVDSILLYRILSPSISPSIME